MAFDFAIDLATGDWVFGGNRDLLPVSGDALTKQRIKIRTVIPRGSFIYDDTETLGSRLYELMRKPTQISLVELAAVVDEALEPMGDIRVVNVQVAQTDTHQLWAHIRYAPVTNLPETIIGESDTSKFPVISIQLS